VAQPTPTQAPPKIQEKAEIHEYHLSIVDINGNPLEGVKIEYTIKDQENIVKEATYLTGTDGSFVVTTEATGRIVGSFKGERLMTDSTLMTYSTTLDYRITKDGYWTQIRFLKIDGIPEKDSHRFLLNILIESIRNPRIQREDIDNLEDSLKELTYDVPIKSEKIILIKPADYINPTFAASEEGTQLKEKVIAFIDLIIVESLLGDSNLKTQSIDLITFKGNKYLQFKLENANVFNSLKMNKYDIGKNIFDETIRKILTPLNQYISDPEVFYGYDIQIIGYTKSFTDEDASPESIEYRFIMPQETVRKYKDKDISGQRLLDESIILMDDERIELKLQ